MFSKSINIYQFLGLVGGYMVHLIFLFIIHKNRKSTRAWHTLKSNSTFWFSKNFLWWIIKKNYKKEPLGTLLLFLYELSIVVLIDFIAILLTPGIFLIQIVNTNMYLIHFYSKNNIKMHIFKSWVLKFQNPIRHSLYFTMWWNKLFAGEKSF